MTLTFELVTLNVVPNIYILGKSKLLILLAPLLVALGTISFFFGTLEPIEIPVVVEHVLDVEDSAISEVNALEQNTKHNS